MPAQAGGTHDSASARKQQLRADLRRRRTGLPASVRRRAAIAAARHLLRSRALRQSRRVAIYLSHASELDTAPLLRMLQRRGLAVYVPEVLPSGRMCFVRLHPGTRLRPGRLGLLQPAGRRPRCGVRQLQIILLPLLGFDDRGRRLGQGGGYYDRALTGCRNRPRPLRLGYAYAVQQVDAVPAEHWDIGLDAVVTEHGLRRFRQP